MLCSKLNYQIKLGHMPFYILNLLMAFGCIIHIFKTGQERYWIYIVIILPVAGFLAYLLMIVIPGLMNTRRGYKVTNKLKKMLNPQAELKAATREYEISQTFINQKRLGDALFSVTEYQQALLMYQGILKGLYSTDPEILLQIAKCQLHLEDSKACLETLSELKIHNPDFHTPDGHLYYAKALSLQGKIAEARHEFDALIQYYPGFEARVCYGEALISWDDLEAAKVLLQALSQEAKRSERHVRELNEASLTRMKKILAQYQW